MPTPNPSTRMKITLKMAILRLRFIQNKETAIAKQQRRSMADLLTQGKELAATIRVENIIRMDMYVELLEYLELYCELLSARVGLLDSKVCDPGLVEAVLVVIYAAPHTDIKELGTIRELLVHKFGPEFAASARDNEDGVVPKKVVERCEIKAPEERLVTLYLVEIAKAYGAPYSKLIEAASDDDDDEGGLAELEAAILITEEPDAEAPILVKPPHASTLNPAPSVKVPSGVSVRKNSVSKPAPDSFDELRKRFEALKR